MENRLTPAQLEQFHRMSTCLVASAIETFRVRLPNTGFANASIRCIYEDQPPVAGYAVTARIRSSRPPWESEMHFDYYDRTDWWNYILTIPAPRIVVIEDMDNPPGLGAFIGEVHANILLGLGCTAVVTNGAVRDVTDLRPTEFQMFAGNVSVSHAYAHLFDFGSAVEVGGLKVRPGDLIHGDYHGVQTIPLEIADKVTAVARAVRQRRANLIALRRSADFTLDKLRQEIKTTALPFEDSKK